MKAQTLALEKLRCDVDMAVFQELLDLDTPEDIFSKDVAQEYLVLAPEILLSMSESLYVVIVSSIFRCIMFTDIFPVTTETCLN